MLQCFDDSSNAHPLIPTTATSRAYTLIQRENGSSNALFFRQQSRLHCCPWTANGKDRIPRLRLRSPFGLASFGASQAIETLFALDFAEPVRADAELGQRLAEDAAGALRLLQGKESSLPVVVSGDAIKGWLAQPNDVRLEEA